MRPSCLFANIFLFNVGQRSHQFIPKADLALLQREKPQQEVPLTRVVSEQNISDVHLPARAKCFSQKQRNNKVNS